jgi:DHA1 family tetracycline resistance protein-like MFS transporter
MRQPLFVLLAVLLIDAIGLGLIMPILPGLLQSMAGGGDAYSFHYGALLAVYALAQFLCAPLLGALSDRYGRRRVLLVSLGGAALDYLLMALAPSLAWLYLGRVLAGVTGANMAVASAYLTDITPPPQRAARFGQMGAAIGMGFIAGPVLGGLLGDWMLRAPFVLAALFNAANLLLVWWLLPEPHPAGRSGPATPATPAAAVFGSLNAFAALHRLRGRAGLGPLVPLLPFAVSASARHAAFKRTPSRPKEAASWLLQWAITIAPSVRQEISVAVVRASASVSFGLILRRMGAKAWMYSS